MKVSEKIHGNPIMTTRWDELLGACGHMRTLEGGIVTNESQP